MHLPRQHGALKNILSPRDLDGVAALEGSRQLNKLRLGCERHSWKLDVELLADPGCVVLRHGPGAQEVVEPLRSDHGEGGAASSRWLPALSRPARRASPRPRQSALANAAFPSSPIPIAPSGTFCPPAPH